MKNDKPPTGYPAGFRDRRYSSIAQAADTCDSKPPTTNNKKENTTMNNPVDKNVIKTTCLTEKEAAKYINMSRSFLRISRMDNYLKSRTPGPHYIRLGRTIRYFITDLDAWLNEHRVKQKPIETPVNK